MTTPVVVILEFPVLCPSISNLNGRGFGYLTKMLPHLPPDCAIAFHRYPAGVDFEASHHEYPSRFDEVNRLRELARGRELWNTETGWAEQNRDYTLSELQVAERMEREHAFWSSSGVKCWTPYQVNDDVIDADDDHDARRLKTYGGRRPDGTWKPWADRIGELR